jgi:hypothetical protein
MNFSYRQIISEATIVGVLLGTGAGWASTNVTLEQPKENMSSISSTEDPTPAKTVVVKEKTVVVRSQSVQAESNDSSRSDAVGRPGNDVDGKSTPAPTDPTRELPRETSTPETAPTVPEEVVTPNENTGQEEQPDVKAPELPPAPKPSPTEDAVG